MQIFLVDGAEQCRSAVPDIVSRFRAVTHNTGNLLFFHALKRQLPTSKSINWIGDAQNETGTLVLSLANFINPHTDMTRSAEILSHSRLSRIVLAGCGAQARDYNEDLQLRPDTLRFLAIVRERSRSIGVRGTYTANLLYKNGFKELRIIGCPSVYLLGPDGPMVRWCQYPKRIGIGVTPTGHTREYDKELYRFGIENSATYILQSEDHLLALFENKPTDKQKEKLNFFTKYYLPEGITQKQFELWLRTHSAFFFDAEEWMVHSTLLDLFVSSRIHGSIAAIHGGCPAITLVHDSRTQELCEHFRLPHMPISNFDASLAPDYLLDLASNIHDFQSIYWRRFTEYKTFMEENGLSPNLNAEAPACC